MFSSTASLYGNNCIDKPVTEDTLLDPVNPYAETKLMGERMIYWMANRYDWKYVIFRYFNVAGAEMDASNGLRVKNPTHIIPNINKTALGQNDSLKIFEMTTIHVTVHVFEITFMSWTLHRLMLKE